MKSGKMKRAGPFLKEMNLSKTSRVGTVEEGKEVVSKTVWYKEHS